MPLITVYKIISRHAPELGETQPRHADCLRYDLAFHDPADMSRVIFPVFTGRDGNTTRDITWGRWQAYGFKVEQELAGRDTQFLEGLDAWITYRHVNQDDPDKQTDYSTLEPVTMKDYLAARRNPKMKLANRHR